LANYKFGKKYLKLKFCWLDREFVGVLYETHDSYGFSLKLLSHPFIKITVFSRKKLFCAKCDTTGFSTLSNKVVLSLLLIMDSFKFIIFLICVKTNWLIIFEWIILFVLEYKLNNAIKLTFFQYIVLTTYINVKVILSTNYRELRFNLFELKIKWFLWLSGEDS
jgi:hypothetical protein